MKILLDTHSFIWLDKESQKMSEIARAAVADRKNTLFLSLISIWEIQIKLQIGKLSFPTPLKVMVEEQLERNNIQLLVVNLSHVLKVGELPLHHRDPFDRLLIAQAIVEDFTLLSKDENFRAYPVTVLW